jgi:hypothetical protein
MHTLAARSRYGWPMLCIVALLFAAAWIEPLLLQRSFPRLITIGGHDLGLAQGWSAKEISNTLPGIHGLVKAPYRWSGASSDLIFAFTAQGQPHLVTLQLLSGRPSTPVRLAANSQPLGTFEIAPLLRRYQIYVPGELVGQSLTLRLDTPTFSPPDDDRVLGLIGLEARAKSIGRSTWLPRPTLPLFLLGLLLLLLANGLTLIRSLVVTTLALTATLVAGLAAPAATLAAARTLAQLLLIAALVVGIAQWLSRRRYGADDQNDWQAQVYRGWRWATAVLLLLTIFLFRTSMSADGVEYYAYLRSLAVDGDIEFTNELLGPEVPFERIPTSLARPGPTGYAQNLASVGPAIIWVPFYLLGSLLARGGNAFGANWTTDGYSLPYIAMINLASVVSLPITAWLCYLIARRVADRRIALLAAIALVAGSAIIDYGLFESHYPHALAAMAVAAYFYWWLRTRPERTLVQWIVLGILAGAMALIYWVNALLLLLPALDLLPLFVQALRARGWHTIGRLSLGGLLFLAAMLITFSPQMIAWQILYGAPFVIPHGSGFAEPNGLKVFEMLFSPVHGQLLWAPITIVAMIGMGWYIAQRRWEGALVLLTFALYFLYNATLSSWHGGGPFGLRRIANVLPLLTPGLACLLGWIGQRHRDALSKAWHRPLWPLTVCALCLGWNAAMLLRYLTYLVPHHPGELGSLSISEFLLAPDNLPWYKLPQIIDAALFPRMLIQGIGDLTSSEWVPFGLLLGTTVLALVATMAGIMWLHAQVTGASLARQSQVVSLQPAEG